LRDLSLHKPAIRAVDLRDVVTDGFSRDSDEYVAGRHQANAKTIEGAQHPDRDAQFRYLNEQARDPGTPVTR
jgi:hypothetical protein